MNRNKIIDSACNHVESSFEVRNPIVILHFTVTAEEEEIY